MNLKERVRRLERSVRWLQQTVEANDDFIRTNWKQKWIRVKSKSSTMMDGELSE